MIRYLIIFGVLCFAFASQTESSKLVEKAVQITTKYYKEQVVTSVVWMYNDSEEISEFLMKYSGSVVTNPILDDNNDSIILTTVEKYGYMPSVFFATKSQQFENFMSLVNKNLRFSFKLLLVFEKPIKSVFELSNFVRIAWNHQLVNIVIISKDYNGEIITTTYYPYSKGVCENLVPVKLDLEENLFPNKFRNFNKCHIRIRALHFLPYVDKNKIKSENGVITGFGGHDGKIFSLIAHKLNATLDVNLDGNENEHYGTFSKGIATGGFADLVYNKADILLPSGLLALSRYSVSQTSHNYYNVDIRWIGPKRREIYSELKLLLPFLDIITPVLCLTFTIFVIVALLIRRFYKYNHDKKKNVSYQTFALLLGQVVNFETKITLLNNFFLLWIWFCFIVRIAYQGDLVRSFQNKLLEPPFKSLEDAVARVNGYGGSDVIIEYYRDTPLEHNYKILALVDIRHYFESIAKGERFLIATDTFLIQHIRHSLQVLDTKIGSATTCLYMRPGWPAAQMLDSVVVKLVESGIIEYIRTSENAKSQKFTNKDSNVQPLDMTMLCTFFYVLGVMYVLCFVIFIIEIMYAKCS